MIAVITTSNRGHNDKAETEMSGAEGQYVTLDGDALQYVDVTYGDIFRQFTILGWTAFGGPAAHIGLFQRVRHMDSNISSTMLKSAAALASAAAAASAGMAHHLHSTSTAVALYSKTWQLQLPQTSMTTATPDYVAAGRHSRCKYPHISQS
jgi:hypothetical protein